MINIGLFDGSFMHQESMTLGGDNKHEKPAHISWVRERITPLYFVTDMWIEKSLLIPGHEKHTRIALLLEPPSLTWNHYKKALELKSDFDCILTFMRDYPETETEFMFYALGGSWIKPKSFGVKKKSQSVSIVASQKTGAVGHRLRHSIVAKFPNISAFGHGYTPVASKVEALAPYRYSIVVESCKERGYFSEKLVDCISQGTVPIYWGCSDVGEYFDSRGIIAFDSMEELEHILNNIVSEEDYAKRSLSVNNNLAHCWNYRCSEDWIYRNYPFLFEECEAMNNG